jgi:CheY-like chemotaxis protein
VVKTTSRPPEPAIGAAPILVVDDDPAIRETVAEILRFEGYEVESAADGEQALEALARCSPAVVLLDMRMPVLDGWGFARAVKERGLRVPILVMTAARDAQLWCEEIGANGCVPKPFELMDVLNAVEGVVHGPASP